MKISQPVRPDSSSLVSLQALRAIAAWLVFWGHAINAVNLKVAAEFPTLYGQFGVDLFFAISGFVMVYSSEGLFGRPGAPIKFFARRVARIVPLYWAATAILVWFVVPYASTKAVLGSLLFAPHVPSEAPLLFVGWTLVFEMFFYTVFALALLARRRFAVVAGAGVFLIAFSVLLGPASGDAARWAHPPAASGIAYLADPVIFEFLFGMTIALVYRAGVRLSLWTTIGSIIVAVTWLTATLDSLPRPYSAGIAAALIVAGMSLSSMPSPKRSALIRGVVFLGDSSYALYCTHLLSFSLVGWSVTGVAVSPVGHAWAYMAVMLATGLAIAAATYLIFEKPTTNFLKTLIKRRGRPVSSAMAKYKRVRSAVPRFARPRVKPPCHGAPPASADVVASMGAGSSSAWL
ncbi:MAG: acyltransferase [Xanthobacteraceae bacterium]